MSNFFSSLLDTAIVPGFSRIGFIARSRINHWDQVSSYDLTGKVVVITGPTSGLGKECVRILAPTGAQLVLVARNKEKCEDVISSVRNSCTGPEPVCVVAEMGDLQSVGNAAREIATRFSQVFAVVHNAGALLNTREESPQGIEQTVASHVLGPHLLTTVLLNTCHQMKRSRHDLALQSDWEAELLSIDVDQEHEMKLFVQYLEARLHVC